MDIIQQVIEIITREHYSILEETLRNKGDIGDFVLKTKEMLDVVGTKLVKDALEAVDDSCICQPKFRSKDHRILGH